MWHSASDERLDSRHTPQAVLVIVSDDPALERV